MVIVWLAFIYSNLHSVPGAGKPVTDVMPTDNRNEMLRWCFLIIGVGESDLHVELCLKEIPFLLQMPRVSGHTE